MKPVAARWLLCVVALGGACPSARADDDWELYYRSSLGSTGNGDNQTAFQLAGAPAKYRLGNEPETYSELTGHTDLLRLGNGVKIGAGGKLAINGDLHRTSELSSVNTRSVAEAYLQATDIPGLPGARVWVGRRYYRRNDVHINDFFYWNPSGDGLGIEDMPIGSLRLSYAYFRKDNGRLDRMADRHDFQLSGIQTNPNGRLEVGLSLVKALPGAAGGHDGWSLTLQHRQTHFAGGNDKFAIQYGVGPGIGLGQTGDITADSATKRLRLINSLDWKSGKNFTGELATIYQRDQTPSGTQTWTSFGIRPVYAFSDHFKLAIEVGQDRVRPATGETRVLNKITIAPTISRGKGFYDRPEIRFFYTYARWNGAAQSAAAAGSALSDTGPFGASRGGSTFGIQVESW